MDVHILALLLFTHFISDFVLQSRDTGYKKSESNFILFKHALIDITIPAAVMMVWVIYIKYAGAGEMHPLGLAYYFNALVFAGLAYCLITLISHFCIDYCTSRLTKKYYMEDNEVLFWATHGLDQFLHIMVLIYSLKLLGFI